jgi:hypothetical protein
MCLQQAAVNLRSSRKFVVLIARSWIHSSLLMPSSFRLNMPSNAIHHPLPIIDMHEFVRGFHFSDGVDR